jgi:hypothetical protein
MLHSLEAAIQEQNIHNFQPAAKGKWQYHMTCYGGTAQAAKHAKKTFWLLCKQPFLQDFFAQRHYGDGYRKM